MCGIFFGSTINMDGRSLEMDLKYRPGRRTIGLWLFHFVRLVPQVPAACVPLSGLFCRQQIFEATACGL
jgi:hypothetical protein